MVHLLVRFARLVAGAAPANEVLPLLAEAGVGKLGADAAAVIQVGDDGRGTVVASQALPARVSDWHPEVEIVGPELGHELLAGCGDAFTQAHTLPLVAGADLFGALVLLHARPRPLDGDRRELAEGLTDLAALALSKRANDATLGRAAADLRASQDALARTEKLRALGQMAGGIAHDLMNIMNPLALQLQLLRRRLDTDRDAAREIIGRMEDVVRLGAQTVERLRNFSRQAPEPSLETTDLNRLVHTALDLGRARTGERAGVQLREELGTPPPTLATASELLTAVVNLVTNALEAMPGGGTIVVRTGEADGGGWIDVIDDGPGMPPEVERRVFEPFFTTKAEGTGLGLAMVQAFVQRQGGKLTLETAPGRGTRFRLWFPGAAS